MIGRISISASLLLLQACGSDDPDVVGTWRNSDGDTIVIGGRGSDDRIVGRLSDRWDIVVREHPFGGVSLGFTEGQNVQGGGAAMSFITTGELSVFCAGCTIDLANDERPSDLMRCASKEISIEQFGMKLDSAEFDCEWNREPRAEPLMERTR